MVLRLTAVEVGVVKAPDSPCRMITDGGLPPTILPRTPADESRSPVTTESSSLSSWSFRIAPMTFVARQSVSKKMHDSCRRSFIAGRRLAPAKRLSPSARLRRLVLRGAADRRPTFVPH